MVRVMASGVFDILHPGHVHFLEEAKKLGNELIVVVARDSTAVKMKHVPIIPENLRKEMVGYLKPVDKAILGHEKENIYEILKEIKPDIIAIGYDQKFDEKEVEIECEKRGLNIKVVRLSRFVEHDLNGTRKIIREIVKRYSETHEKDRHS